MRSHLQHAEKLLAKEDRAVRHWLAEVSKAAIGLERRWTVGALKRVAPDVARRLHEQRGLFDRACVTGTPDEVELHGAAMCRGYALAVKTLEAANEADDAYLLGQDPRSGFKVAIGHQKCAAERVQELHGLNVVWISPDEVAAVLASMEGFKFIGAAKQLWPGAEVIDIHPGEPAKAESGIGEAA